MIRTILADTLIVAGFIIAIPGMIVSGLGSLIARP